MGEFFNGWRRKAGCTLLVMAIVAVWLPSHLMHNGPLVVDHEYDPDIEPLVFRFRSNGLCFIKYHYYDGSTPPPPTELFHIWYSAMLLPVWLISAYLILESAADRKAAKPTQKSP